MFPFEIEEDDEVQESSNEDIEYKEYEIDFVTGQLTGRIVSGIEAVKTWVYLALHTPKYRYLQYSWDYGIELEELIGQVADEEYIQSELQRMLEECLLVNEHITEVELLEFRLENEKINGIIKVLTDYGEEEWTFNV